MACNGNATEQCGGPDRLTVFNTTAPPGPVGPFVNPGVNGYHSLGCYKYVFISVLIRSDLFGLARTLAPIGSKMAG